MKPVGGHTEVQQAWQAWTFVDFGQKNVWPRRSPRGGGQATDCRPLEVLKPWQVRTFAAAEVYDPKVILGARTLDPRGDAYYGS